jgi:hypothetical protein
LPELPKLFDLLGGDSWTVYRFLIQHHPELEGGYNAIGIAALPSSVKSWLRPRILPALSRYYYSQLFP